MTADPRPRAVVTGASSGIGAVYARRLAEAGHDLVVVARRRDRLDSLAEELQEGHGAAVDVAVTDLSSRSDVWGLAERLADERVDFLVSCAGFAGYKPFAEQEPSEADALIDVHVSAATRLTRAVLPGMLERGSGRVVNVASLLAFSESLPVEPLPFRAVYSGAKAYLVAFTQCVQEELRDSGVQVQVCCPGLVATEFHAVEGIDRSKRPFKPMAPEDVVHASLTALALGEPLCLPGLDEPGAIDEYHAHQRRLVQLANTDRLATRYSAPQPLEVAP